MYNSGIIANIRIGNKILREKNNVVYLPFKSEYNITFKNLSNKRAFASIYIDGNDVLCGRKLCLDCDRNITILERYLEDDLNIGHKFRFIEKTDQISDYRGDKIEDGIIDIKFNFEGEKKDKYKIYNLCSFSSLPSDIKKYNKLEVNYSNELFSNSSIDYCYIGSSTPDIAKTTRASIFSESRSLNENINEEGITVKGTKSDQAFTECPYVDLDSVTHVMIFRLKGSSKYNIPIYTPLITSTKLTCPTCGTKSRSQNNFCYKCGTALD